MKMRAEVIFEYSIVAPFRFQKPRKHHTRRVVRDSSGYFRVEQKGIDAKSWRTVSWGGTLENHYASAICDCRKGFRYSDLIGTTFPWASDE